MIICYKVHKLGFDVRPSVNPHIIISKLVEGFMLTL
jgi:hypothetical protein